jgi:hypothetical protein
MSKGKGKGKGKVKGKGKGKGKGKAIPLQAWTGPGSFRRLRLPDCKAHECGKVVSHMNRPLLPPKNYSWYSFLLEVESTPEP